VNGRVRRSVPDRATPISGWHSGRTHAPPGSTPGRGLGACQC
jgi:hypothetical protein